MIVATTFSNAFADNANDVSSSCNAEMAVRLKDQRKI
jgi:hypothetical protein